MEPRSEPVSASPLRRTWWIPTLVIASASLAVFLALPNEPPAVPTGDLVAAKRGPLTITVNSAGSIRSADAVVLKNKVEGRTSILWIIDEGTVVEEGTVLVELDKSQLEDEKLEEEIEVESSRAAYINAEQMLQIAEKQGEADIESSGVQYRLALLDLEKYTGIDAVEYERRRAEGEDLANPRGDSLLARLNSLSSTAAIREEDRVRFRELLETLEGSYKQEMRKALNAIVLAEAEVQRAADQFQGSKTLHEKGYVTEQELDADRLDLQRKTLDREVAIGEIELLAKFTFKRTIEELLSEVSQKRFLLEKAKHEAEANIVDARANMHARNERLVRDEQNLREINEQIEACTVRAPHRGMVVYGTSGRDRRDRVEPLAEGVEVRERQDLILLPTTQGMVADIKLHESILEKVEVGMPVRLTSDALKDRVFWGEIRSIALLPDANSRWLNPDMKVYNTIVAIDDSVRGLRTGMSCKSEIVVRELEDAVHVPIQAVVRLEGRPFVYVPGPGDGLHAKAIETGLDDNRVIQVLSGLDEGELVSLTPPLREAVRPQIETNEHSAGPAPVIDGGIPADS